MLWWDADYFSSLTIELNYVESNCWWLIYQYELYYLQQKAAF